MKTVLATLAGVLLLGSTCSALPPVALSPVALRAENFTVPPSTQPLAFVVVKNLSNGPYRGSVTMKGPEGWRIAPPARQVELAPGETGRVPFTIEKGRNVEANSYPVEVSATAAGTTVTRRQDIACASAPYFKPTIDGNPSEWKDAIPISFTTADKKTTISTYWNRRQFSILVAVEEDKLVHYLQSQTESALFDAVQVAVSPLDPVADTTDTVAQRAGRFEFLLVSAGDVGGRCFQLATPATTLAETANVRTLRSLVYEKAQVAVSRKEGVTYYECGIPFSLMRDAIRPSEGREFFMSVLVHDPDGTGVRDLGQAAGLWPTQRSASAWSRWMGAKWGKTPPYDNKLRWGLCTSKY
ncbi:MAG: hypothetical protein HQ567_24325 [Candidatus Nealsonbacteria bacterium]|nr:hypothetical protein [Candidatus Nealsonbacteria bacterium]